MAWKQSVPKGDAKPDKVNCPSCSKEMRLYKQLGRWYGYCENCITRYEME